MSSGSDMPLLLPSNQTWRSRWNSGIKSPGALTQQHKMKEVSAQQFPCSNSRENDQTQGIFLHVKKRGSSIVLFLFLPVGSCISASHLRFPGSHMIVYSRHMNIAILWLFLRHQINLHPSRSCSVNMVAWEKLTTLFKPVVRGGSKHYNMLDTGVKHHSCWIQISPNTVTGS